MFQVATERIFLFYEKDLKVLICQFQGCCHTGHASAHNKGFFIYIEHDVLKRLDVVGVHDSHPDKGLCLLRCTGLLVHVDPRTLVSDICHLKKILIQTSVSDRSPEKRLVSAGRAGRNYYPV